MDKTNVVVTVIMSIAIGYVLAVMLILLVLIDASVCKRMGYDAASITWKLQPVCVTEISVPYSDVLSELDET